MYERRYKGELIYFNEKQKQWVWQAGGASSADLRWVEGKIDRAQKAQVKAKPVNAILNRYRDEGYPEVKVTSIAEVLSSSFIHFWTTRKLKIGSREETKREKLSINDLLKDTPENRRLIAEIKELRKQIEELDKLVSEKQGKFKQFELSDFKQAQPAPDPQDAVEEEEV